LSALLKFKTQEAPERELIARANEMAERVIDLVKTHPTLNFDEMRTKACIN